MSAWVGLITGAHAMIAMSSQQPHWLLSDPDAKRYGTALANAARHLPVTMTQKALDFSALAMAFLQFDMPRIAISYQLARGQNPFMNQPQRPVAQVFPFPGSPFQPGPPPGAQVPRQPVSQGPGDMASGPAAAGQGRTQEPVEGFTGDGIDAPIGGA